MPNRLAHCLQKAITRFTDEQGNTRPVLDHLMKRGLIAEAHRIVSSKNVTVHEAEVQAVQEMRDKATADVAKMEAALTAAKPAKAKKPPAAQASGPRPVQRDEMTKATIARMHATPEEAFQLAHRVRQSFEKVRAKTKAMQAAAPPPAAPVTPEESIDQLDARETKALEDLNADLEAAKQGVSDKIAEQYSDRIANAKTVEIRKHNEALAETARINRLRGLEREYAVKRKLIAQDFTRQRQVARAKARDVTLRESREGKEAAAKLEHVRAFAELNALISALPPELRGLVGGTTTLAQLRGSGQSIEKFLAVRIEQMDKLMEEHYQKMYRDRIDALLARKKPKKTGAGVKKSTVGADAQDVVDRVAKMVKTPIDEVYAKVQALELELAAGGLTPEQEAQKIHEQEEWNTFGDTSQMTSTQLEAAHNSLAQTIKDGQAVWGAKEEARLADYRRKAAEIQRVLPKATESGVSARNEKAVQNIWLNYARSHTSLVQVIERLFHGASFVQEWQSKAIKSDNADQDYVRDVQRRFTEAIRVASNSTFTWQVGDILNAMRTKTVPVPDGGKASKFEAMQFLFAWGQPAVQERMRKFESPWTDAHMQAVRDALNDPVSQAVMRFMQAGYEEIYQKTDPVYTEMYGMHLPRIEGQYAPMRYRSGGNATDMTMTGGAPSSGITPTALKARVEHSHELKQVDAFEVFMEHLQQMSHWIHFAPFIRETRGVLNNEKAKQALEQAIGREGVGDLQKQLDTVTRQGVARSMEVSGVNKFINHITRAVATGAMAFNMHSAAVQGDSALRWLHAIPISRWHKALLYHNWLKEIIPAWKHNAVQRRVMNGMNPSVRAAMDKNKLSPWKLVRALDAGFWHLQWTDGILTSFSSAIVYTDAVKNQGMSHEQALEMMDEAVAKYSQPTASVSKAAALLTGGPATRMYLLFMADPTLKTALANEGLMNIGRGNLELGIRRIVATEVMALTSQFILNAWAHFLGQGAVPEGDEDEWWYQHFWRAAIMAPLQGWFVAGNIAEGLIRWAFDEKWYQQNTAIASAAQYITSFLTHADALMSLDPTDEDFQKEVMRLVKVLPLVSPGAGSAAAGTAKAWQGYQWITGEE